MALLLALFFGDTNFLFEKKILTFWGKELNLNGQLLMSGLAVLILVGLLLLGLIEKVHYLFKSNKNIKNGMAVLDGKNFIGRIVDVNFFSSRVLLVSDLNSKIPVVIEPSGAHAILSLSLIHI